MIIGFADMSFPRQKSNVIGSVACVIFALLSLGFGIAMFGQVRHMESVGLHADGSIVRMHTGARNNKTPIIRFLTREGLQVETKCLFRLFAIRHEIGEEVTVLYDPARPERAMIDNGIWNWDQPMFGFAGGALLMGLAVLLFRALPGIGSE